MNIKLKKKLVGLSVFAMLFAGILAPFMAYTPTDAWGRCHESHVLVCGATSRQNLVNQINNGDGTHNDIKGIFGSLGIYGSDILGPNTYEGEVRKDNTVWIGNTLVARGVSDGQRGTVGILGGYTPWAGLDWAYPTANFAANSISAWVYMKDGYFQYAVLKPCGNPVFAHLQAIPPSITIQKEVANVSKNPNDPWVKSDSAAPGDTLAYRIKVQNNSKVTAEGVTVRDYIPAGTTLVPGSGKIWFTTNSVLMNDASITGGAGLGNLVPGQIVWITLQVKVNPAPDSCHLLTNTVTAKGNYTTRVTDTANTGVICAQAKYIITIKKFNDLNGDGKQESGEGMLSGWTFTLTGNGLNESSITDANGSLSFQGLNAGQYTVTETMQSGWKSTTGTVKTVSVGPDQTVIFGNQQIVTPPPSSPPPVTPSATVSPTTLPVSGPVETGAGVLGTSALGYVGYLWRRSKKRLLESLKKF